MVRKKHLFFGIIFLLVLSISFYFVSADVTWSNFHVFDGATAPYASNGPGCKGGGYVPNNVQLTAGMGCPSNNAAYDLGAVWVDIDTNFLAWQIQAPNLTGAGICGGSKNNATIGSNNFWGITVEFDADSNVSSGCRLPNMTCFQTCIGAECSSCSQGDMCYPGSEYRFYVFGDNSSRFEIYNRSLTNCGTLPNACWQVGNATLNSMYNISWIVSCGTPSTLKIAVNRSAITGLSGMTFQTNSLGGGIIGPVDMLGGFDMEKGGFQRGFVGGAQDAMFTGQHPCNNLSQPACNSSSSTTQGNFSCNWDTFMNKCMPTMQFGSGAGSGMTCSDFCGSCIGDTNCTNGAKGKCKIVSAPTMGLPPNAVTWNSSGLKMCVEDPTKFMYGGNTGGGSCDSDCKYCFSNSTCSNSGYPNPLGTGSGCKWVVDTVFNRQFCVPSTFNDTAQFICSANQLDRCFNSSNCATAGGNWSIANNFCMRNGTSICWDGAHCSDSACSKEKICGGDINVLTGGFGTLDPMEAMKKQMFSGMDMSPPVMLSSSTPNNTVSSHLDILMFQIKDMGSGLGMGIGVRNMTNSTLCGTLGTGKYYYYMDIDNNQSTGCNITLTSVYQGFDYRFEYDIENNGTNVTEIRKSFRCVNNNFSLFPAKLSGAPDQTFQGYGGGQPTKISCNANSAILAIDKSDIGNPSRTVRFMISTSYNSSSYPDFNDSLTGNTGNNGILYTPGTIDQRPSDCFSNPIACGTAFSVIGGGKFMPHERCDLTSQTMGIDANLNGLIGCNDPDCMNEPRCAGTNYSTNATSAPSLLDSKAESFGDFVFIHWIADQPAIGNISLFNNCMNSTPSNIFNLPGYMPFKDMGIKNGMVDPYGNTTNLTSGNTYFYKITVCNIAGLCGTSACLNFTTQAPSSAIKYQFNFVPPTNPMVNTTSFKLWNGTAYENISTSQTMNKTQYISDGKILFDNPQNNWSIELNGVDLAKAVTFNLTTAFNVTNSSGKTYVGLDPQAWTDMAQNLGADNATIKIPNTGSRLMKCSESNISDCSDATSSATLIETNLSGGYTKWSIPTTLGFSSYTVDTGPSPGNYSVIFANLSAISKTANILQNASYLINVTNNDTIARTYNLTIVPNSSNARGYVNGSSSFQIAFGNSSNVTSSYIIAVNITTNTSETISFIVNATLFNDSLVSLNSTSEINLTATFTDNVAPVVHLQNPANNSYISANTNIFYCNITDESRVFNLTIYVYNSTTQINTTTNTLSGNSYFNSTSFTIPIPREGNYTWDCLGYDFAGNSAWSAEKNYSIAYDTTYPLINYTLGVENSGANKSQNWTFINISFTETNLKNITFNLYNSSNNLINATNYSTATYSLNFTNLVDGTYYYNVTIFDQAGNYNYTTTNRITLDTANPASTPNTPANNSYSNTTIQNLTSNITDNLGIKNATLYVYNSSGDLYNQTTTNFGSGVISTTIGTVVNLVQDIYVWFYRLFDWSGNSVTSANRTLTTDTTYPLINYTLGVENSEANKSQNWTFINISFTETNLKNITFNLYNSSNNLINATNYSTATYSLNFTNLVDGTYYYNVTIFDQAGNYNYTTTNRITLDTAAPTITIISPINNTVYYANNSFIINFTASDTRTLISSRWYNYNGTTNVTFTSAVTINYSSTGSKNISFYANDSANNLATKMYTITVNSVNSTTFISNDTSYNVSTNITNIVVPSNSTLQNITLTNSSQIATIDLTQLLNNNIATISSNNLSLATIGTINYTVIIPGNTNITATSSWDGKITLPTVNTSTFTAPTISGGTTSVDTVIEVGSTIELNFTNPVEIIISGKAGKRAAWTRGNLTLVNIDTICNSGNATNTTAPSNINSTIRECYTADGNNLNIWTLHFTQFSAYTYTATAAASTTGSSSGGGGSSASTTTIYNVTDSQLTAGYTKELVNNNKMSFVYSGATHTLTLKSVSATQITVSVSSTPQQKTINIGTEALFDLNGDLINDISVKYVSFLNNKATILIKKIAPAATTPPTTPPATTPPTTEPIIEPPTAGKTNKLLWPIVIIIMVIIAGVIIYLSIRNYYFAKSSTRRKFMI